MKFYYMLIIALLYHVMRFLWVKCDLEMLLWDSPNQKLNVQKQWQKVLILFLNISHLVDKPQMSYKQTWFSQVDKTPNN